VGKWVAIGAGALVAVFAAVIGIHAALDAKYLKPGNSPLLSNSLSSIKVDDAAQAKCADLAAALPSAETVQAWNSRAQVMDKYVSGAARRASTFLGSTAWIDSTDLPDISAALDTALAGGLDDVISKTDTIRASDRQAFADLWAEDFKNLAVDKCGLTAQLAAANDAESAFKTSKDSLVTLAASVPWYPDGYTEWTGDSNVAWKWVNGRDCSYDYCWHVAVVAQTGCASGVYVEINILDSAGNVTDYANGTLSSLAPLQTGIVEVNNSYNATGQVTQISCHQ
jgi:hypothetical protein